MLVAIAIFSIIMVMAVGSLLSIIDANREAQAKKTVVNNLHFALENMARTIRTGFHFHCDADVGTVAAGSTLLPRDCASTPATSVAVIAKGGELVVYRYNAATESIERAIEGGESVPITAPEVKVKQLRFFVSGAANAGQPRIFLVLNGVVQGRVRTPSDFTIETLVSQRVLDVP